LATWPQRELLCAVKGKQKKIYVQSTNSMTRPSLFEGQRSGSFGPYENVGRPKILGYPEKMATFMEKTVPKFWGTILFLEKKDHP
jgi:hypothetical protein